MEEVIKGHVRDQLIPSSQKIDFFFLFSVHIFKGACCCIDHCVYVSVQVCIACSCFIGSVQMHSNVWGLYLMGYRWTLERHPRWGTSRSKKWVSTWEKGVSPGHCLCNHPKPAHTTTPMHKLKHAHIHRHTPALMYCAAFLSVVASAAVAPISPLVDVAGIMALGCSGSLRTHINSHTPFHACRTFREAMQKVFHYLLVRRF